MTDPTPVDRALHALDKAHRNRVRFMFDGLCVQIDSGASCEVAATNFRKGLENSEAAYLLAKAIVADVFGDHNKVVKGGGG